ncbi:hypothetical protein Dimus_031732 [Dionaea muscipula]
MSCAIRVANKLNVQEEHLDVERPKSVVLLSVPSIFENGEGSFDFVFVDADKDNYINYHDILLKLVKVGGAIAYDNTLWYGSVAVAADYPMSERIKLLREYIMKFNTYLASDSRIESTILSIGDGLTLCRRLV